MPQRARSCSSSLVRDRPDLDRRDGCERGRAQHAEALHSLDQRPFRDGVARAADRGGRVDRECDRPRNCLLGGADEVVVPAARSISGHSAERSQQTASVPTTRVPDAIPRPPASPTWSTAANGLSASPRRRRRGLDGPHAADEPVVPAELAIGRSDDEDVGHGPGRVGAAGILRGRRRRHSTSSPADRAAA